MSVILWWLKVDWEVASDFVEKAFLKLINDCFVCRLIELTILAQVSQQHKVSQVEANQQITRIFLAFDRRKHTLDEDHWVFDFVQK